MSGIDEILPWAIENYPPENFDNFRDWFDELSLDFQDNNRLPLEEILDEDEIDIMQATFEKQAEQQQQLEPEEIQETIDDFRVEEPEPKENIIISSIKSIGNSIRNFFGF